MFALPFSVAAAIGLLTFATAVFPFHNVFTAAIANIAFFWAGLKGGWIQKPSAIDLLLVPIAIMIVFFLGVFTGVQAFAMTSATQLMVIAVLSGGSHFLLSFIPIAGRLLSSVLQFILVISLMGAGFTGAVLAATASIIALLPIPQPLSSIALASSFFAFKILAEMVGG